MPPRTLLRMLLSALGAVALGVIGAAVLGAGSAHAAAPPGAGRLSASVDAGSVEAGPLTVEIPPVPVVTGIAAELPAELPVPSSIDVDVPIAGPIAGLPIPIPEVTELAEALGHTPPIPGTASKPAPTRTRLTTAALPVAPRTADRSTVASPGRRSAESGAASASSMNVGKPPVPTSPSFPLPSFPLPFLPWTLGLAGVATALTTARADDRDRQRDGSPFVAVVDSIRDAMSRRIAHLGPARPHAARAGFALILVRPG